MNPKTQSDTLRCDIYLLQLIFHPVATGFDFGLGNGTSSNIQETDDTQNGKDKSKSLFSRCVSSSEYSNYTAGTACI